MMMYRDKIREAHFATVKLTLVTPLIQNSGLVTRYISFCLSMGESACRKSMVFQVIHTDEQRRLDAMATG